MKTLDIHKFWKYVSHGLVPIPNEPHILVDGFILDFNDHNLDKQQMFYVSQARFHSLKSLRESIRDANEVLTDPILVRAGRDNTLCRRFKNHTHEILLQNMYCEYFWRVYPCCEFRIKEFPAQAVAVYFKGTLVGAIAPMVDGTLYRSVKPRQEAHSEK